MVDSLSKADVHVRATVAKFDGKAPTKLTDGLRRLALLGPKLPIGVIVVDDIEGESIEYPKNESKLWVTARLVDWIKKKRGN